MTAVNVITLTINLVNDSYFALFSVIGLIVSAHCLQRAIERGA